MDLPLIITISLMVLIAAVSAGLWARRPGTRPMMGGIGLLLIPLGLFFFGITHLAYNGVISIINWAQHTVWSPMMTWGVSLTGVGLLMFLVSRFVKPAERKTVTESDRPAVAPQSGAGRPSGTIATRPPADKPAPNQGKTSEDAEVEDILRKRGLL